MKNDWITFLKINWLVVLSVIGLAFIIFFCDCALTRQAEKESKITIKTEESSSPTILGNTGSVVINNSDSNDPIYDEVTQEEIKQFDVDHLCPFCKKQNKKSTTWCDGAGMATLAYCGNGYYDENGKYNAPDPCNTFSYGCHCSDGHHWTMSHSTY